jgi:hypothetical protein
VMSLEVPGGVFARPVVGVFELARDLGRVGHRFKGTPMATKRAVGE